jgi:hypothetical protein
VVQGTATITVSNSTSTFADTGLTATITPKFASSKILILIYHNGLRKSVANLANSIGLQILRNASILTGIGAFYGYTNTTLELIVGSASASYLDSPNTTSATIYKTQFSSSFNSASVSVQDNNAPSTIVLMEIAA